LADQPPPDLITAAQTLEKLLAWVEPMAREFKKVSETAGLFPVWHKRQIAGFIKHVGFYSRDLAESYKAKRIDSLAQALRNLMELDVWAEYCNASEENAKQFFDDMSRDIREVVDIHQKLYTHINQEPNERSTRDLKTLRENSATLGVTNLEERFTQVSDAAKQIGRDLKYPAAYKIASKYAHPTALILGLNEYPQIVMDRFYECGSILARSCLGTVEKAILKRCPSFYVQL
jgi:hypothetical protein